MFLVLEMPDLSLGHVVDLLKVLVMPDGGAKMKGEMIVHHLVYCIGKLSVAVQNGQLFRGECKTVVVYAEGLQNMVMNRVTFAKGGGDWWYT